jgi:hypothetical protein
VCVCWCALVGGRGTCSGRAERVVIRTTAPSPLPINRRSKTFFCTSPSFSIKFTLISFSFTFFFGIFCANFCGAVSCSFTTNMHSVRRVHRLTPALRPAFVCRRSALSASALLRPTTTTTTTTTSTLLHTRLSLSPLLTSALRHASSSAGSAVAQGAGAEAEGQYYVEREALSEQDKASVLHFMSDLNRVRGR